MSVRFNREKANRHWRCCVKSIASITPFAAIVLVALVVYASVEVTFMYQLAYSREYDWENGMLPIADQRRAFAFAIVNSLLWPIFSLVTCMCAAKQTAENALVVRKLSCLPRAICLQTLPCFIGTVVNWCLLFAFWSGYWALTLNTLVDAQFYTDVALIAGTLVYSGIIHCFLCYATLEAPPTAADDNDAEMLSCESRRSNISRSNSTSNNAHHV